MSASRARRIADWILGLTLIAVGVVAGFLPLIQGWVLVLAGLAILSGHSRFARAILDRLKRAGRGVRDGIVRRRPGR
ncbi:MAG: PGPGW domain-containing protein [Acidobacteriia bacterium]|nr:PGPGW domain-containing protein [Terriglobia bacterium]